MSPLCEESKFVGRDKEAKHLRKILHTCQNEGTSEIVFVSGASGSGKTTLVETVFKNENCLYGYGKFEMEKMSKPLSSLSQCLSALVQAILDSDDTKKYADLIKEALTAEDVQPLAYLAPEMYSILSGHATPRKTCTKTGTKDHFEYLKYSLRMLARTVALSDRPVVLFMDDLQWIDQTTMEILRSILCFPDVQHVIFVGAYRTEDVGKEHMLSEWIADDAIDVIELKNFQLDQIHEMLVNYFRTEENIQELADLFYNRTNGNILHIVHLAHFIKSHKNPKLLEYSPTQFKYTWKIELIRRYTSLSDSIVGMIVGKMELLSDEAQAFIKMASCFGSSFDKRMLEVIEGQSISGCLDNTIEQGLLERISENVFKFVHDKLYQAALRLCPEEERKRMRFEIGKKLLDHYCGTKYDFQKMDDTALFTCVDLLNIGKDYLVCDEFRLHLAKLNHEAIIRSASFSAFLAAIRYAETAISLLDQNSMWDDNYDFCLELHTLLAEMSSHCGHSEELESSAKKVFDHAKVIDDKLRAYFATFNSKSYVSGELGRVINRLLELLEELGFEVPGGTRIKCRSAAAIRATQKLLESFSDEDILALPQNMDSRKSSSVRLAVMAVSQLDKNNQSCEAQLLLSHALEFTLKEGMCEHSPLVFALYGSALIAYGHSVKMGCRLGSLAILLLDKLESPVYVRIHALSYTAYVNHWQQPLSHPLERRIKAYQEGLRTGDLHGAFFSITMYAMEYFYSGLPLGPFVDDMKRFIDQMAMYGLSSVCFINLPLYQTILNLRGESDNVLDMFTAKESVKYQKKYGWDGKTGMESFWSYGMQIAFYCDEIEIANDYAKKLKRVSSQSTKKRIPWYFGQVRIFFYALIAIHKFRKTGRLKYLHEANKYKSMIEHCINEGSINLPHKLQIIEAEMATLQQPSIRDLVKSPSIRGLVKSPSHLRTLMSGQKSTSTPDFSLQRLYDKAIASSKRSGFLQDAALGALLASKSVNVGDTRYHEMANDLLESWGAMEVIQCLQGKRSSLKTRSITERTDVHSSGSSGYRARTRFVEGIQKEAVDFLSADVPFDQGEHYK